MKLHETEMALLFEVANWGDYGIACSHPVLATMASPVRLVYLMLVRRGFSRGERGAELLTITDKGRELCDRLLETTETFLEG